MTAGRTPPPRAAAQAASLYPSAFRAWTTVSLLSLLLVISFVDRFVLALLIEPLKAELNLSDTQVGLLIGTVFALVYALVAVPLARMADVWNRRSLIALGALLWTSLTTASAFSTAFEMLLVLRIGVAVGEAVLSPAGMSMIADLFPRDRRTIPSAIFIGVGSAGANLSLFVSAGVLDFASTATARALPLVGDLSPWRLTLFLVGLPGMLVALLFLLLPEPRRLEARTETPPMSALFRHVGENGLTYLGFFSLLILGPLNIVSLWTWFPSHLVRAHGLSAAEAGYQFGMVGLVGMIAGCILVPAAGAALARRGRLDAQILVYLAVVVVAGPLLAGALLAESALVSLSLVGPGVALLAGSGAMLVTTSPLLAPGRLRAVMMSLVGLATSVPGLGLGPLIVALLAELAFPGPAGLGKALAAQLALSIPLALAVALATRKAFADSMRRAIELESETQRAREASP